MEINKDSKLYGLLGKNIEYSFSRNYFSKKFEKLGFTNHKYVNFDLQQITMLKDVLEQHKTVLSGINVTIPYKQEVMAFLNSIDEDAKNIGAVNTLKFLKDGSIKGFNTDFYGFKNSIQPLMKSHHNKALILGSGGASKAIAYAFKKMDITCKLVSRTKKSDEVLTYAELTKEIMQEHTIIVDSTPLGTFPQIASCPDIPYEYLSEKHLLYDLTYNPEVTRFLSLGLEKGATIKNGLQMLELQAEKSWEIWEDL